MAWSASAQHRAMVADLWGKTSGIDLDADTLKVTAHPSTITPDKDVTLANSALGAGVWATPVTDTNWPSTGLTLANKAISTPTSGKIRLACDNTPTLGNVTMADVTGLHVYDDTITAPTADPGVCFNYLGGSSSITAGVFTIAWDATNGVMYATV